MRIHSFQKRKADSSASLDGAHVHIQLLLDLYETGSPVLIQFQCSLENSAESFKNRGVPERDPQVRGILNSPC